MTLTHWKYPLAFLIWAIAFLTFRAQYAYTGTLADWLTMFFSGLNAVLMVLLASKKARKGRA